MNDSNKNEKERGTYIIDTILEMSKNGDAFYEKAVIQRACYHHKDYQNIECFLDDFDYLMQNKALHQEGDRIYLMETWRYESYSAGVLAELLSEKNLKIRRMLPNPIVVNGKTLTDEQREAVALALNSRICLIMGGAGTGKTTLIEAIVNQYGGLSDWALCAPTGKASRNLTERTGLPASTVYRILNKSPKNDLLTAEKPEGLRMVIVDEVSMLSLKEFAGLMRYAEDGCRIVLLGDSHQLLSVGSGNVLPDLMALKVPNIVLTECHRQKGAQEKALVNNVFYFNRHLSIDEILWDGSFQLSEIEHADLLMDIVAREGAQRYYNNESVQVITPRNDTVFELNKRMQSILNPLKVATDGTQLQLVLHLGKRKEICFRDGDRVMMLKNDRDGLYSNGDIGILRIEDYDKKKPKYSVRFADGRVAMMTGRGGLYDLSHAYAITIHKSQGSEYDTVIMVLGQGDSRMLYRNLVYTGISRAKRKLKLMGSVQAFDDALKRELEPRKSALVERVQEKLKQKNLEDAEQIAS